jgi:transposase InsO family protein
MPRQLLSDNGLCFTGRLHGRVVDFERRVRSLGIILINSGRYHPETLGKLERFHKTMKEWFADEGPPLDLAHLQQLLDRFRPTTTRTGRTRQSRMPPLRSATGLLRPEPSSSRRSRSRYPRGVIIRTVWRNGVVTYNRRNIGLGRRWAGLKVRIVPAGELIHVYYGKILVRSLACDPARRYQPLGQPEKEVVGSR